VSQITKAFCEQMLVHASRKEHAPLTIWEEEQLARAWLALTELDKECERLRNGLDNLFDALKNAPGLPLETLPQADLEKWTDLITGVMMALGVLKHTGKPMSMWDSLIDSARAEGEV